MKANKFRVRVLISSKLDDEIVIENLSWKDAIDRFLFYVRLNLEMNLGFRCVNIFLGRKCLRMYVCHESR